MNDLSFEIDDRHKLKMFADDCVICESADGKLF